MREAATLCPALCKLTFDLLTLKVVSKSRVTWATSVPILVFLGLSVFDLFSNRRQTSNAHHHLMTPLWGRGHNKRIMPTGEEMRTVYVFHIDSLAFHLLCFRPHAEALSDDFV